MFYYFNLLWGGIFSFFLFHLTSRDELPVKHKLPKIKVSRLEVSPTIRIVTDKKVIHLHHWMMLSILLLISIPLNIAILDATFTKSFFVGGILQGILTPNAGKIVYSSTENWITYRRGYLDSRLIKSPLKLFKRSPDA